MMKKLVKKILGEHVSKFLGNQKRKFNFFIEGLYFSRLERTYLRKFLPNKIDEIRKKDIITVAFVIHELGSWKTEELYKRMLKHYRFNPILLVSDSLDDVNSKQFVASYLKKKEYTFYELKSRETICSQYHPDIIFYQKPYLEILPPKMLFYRNLESLFCYVYYSFRNKKLKSSQNAVIHRFIWQEYVENEVVKNELVSLMDNGASNVYVTGLPVMDELILDKSHYPNPWNESKIVKKKIIYAPHHSVMSDVGLWSTFLLYGEFIQEMAVKYQDKVQWAFKPHPLLKVKLYKIWGVERTDAYYNKWNEMENSQVEMGPYVGLFKHSDAMIHDCGSFMLEYHYTQNPVLYLMLETQDESPINQQTVEAKEAHYKAWNKDDIENFIVNVINGVDPMANSRQLFYKKYLLPPNNLSACDNIINLILGE